MSKEVFTFRYLKAFIDDLSADPEGNRTEEKILSIFAYATVVGGYLSEYNLLTMLAYAAVDLKDDDEKEIVSEIVAFYAGTGIVKFIDNDLGFLRGCLEHDRLAFEIGQDCDTTETLEAIKSVKESIFEDMDTDDFDPFDYEEDDIDDVRSFGTSFCPKCNKAVQLTDTNKFVIHYSSGVGNPFAEVTCEKCGAHYQISTTWKNAYKFDAIGCQALPFSFSRGTPISEEDIEGFMAHIDDEIIEFLNIVWREVQKGNR